MKIITILGKGFVTKIDDRPLYRYDGKLQNLYSLKRQKYTNMLPLLIDNFGYDHIVAIFTSEAKISQAEVLQDEFGKNYTDIFIDRNFIENEKNFYEILRIINESICDDTEYIIDLTHGFRHIPILATISLITQSIRDTSKIRHIFFAKEIEPRKEYEIIDLKEYLELANMSYMLEMFNKNYTVSAISEFENQDFEELRGELNKLSNHILSNSLKALDANFTKILFNIEKIQKNEYIASFKNSLDEIQDHIKELEAICQKPISQKLYEMAKILSPKGYLLNSITLLFEAVGYYCAEKFQSFGNNIRDHIVKFEEIAKNNENKKFSAYQLTHQSRSFVKNPNLFKGPYLFNPQTFGWSKSRLEKTDIKPTDLIKSIENDIKTKLESIENIEKFKNFILKIENLRNNLAHANSDKEISNSKLKLSELLREYKKFCIDEDILGVK